MREFFGKLGMWWLALGEERRGWIVVGLGLVGAFIAGAVIF